MGVFVQQRTHSLAASPWAMSCRYLAALRSPATGAQAGCAQSKDLRCTLTGRLTCPIRHLLTPTS